MAHSPCVRIRQHRNLFLSVIGKTNDGFAGSQAKPRSKRFKRQSGIAKLALIRCLENHDGTRVHRLKDYAQGIGLFLACHLVSRGPTIVI